MSKAIILLVTFFVASLSNRVAADQARIWSGVHLDKGQASVRSFVKAPDGASGLFTFSDGAGGIMAGCRPGSGSSAVFQFKRGPQGGDANAGGDMRVRVGTSGWVSSVVWPTDSIVEFGCEGQLPPP
ncbi:unnamed protein product [Jaminaea pallidilutea]